jgi:hypothetical protein
MNPIGEHDPIPPLLERCQSAGLNEAAWLALQQYEIAAKEIAARPIATGEKWILIRVRRELLEATLIELLNPLGLEQPGHQVGEDVGDVL